MKIFRLAAASILAFFSCQGEDKAYFEGPGTLDDIRYIQKIWGVKIPTTNFTFIRKSEGLVIYLATHDALQPFEGSINRDWKKLEVGESIEHPDFRFNGDVDVKARYASWEVSSSQEMKYIVVDYSTGTVAFIKVSVM